MSASSGTHTGPELDLLVGRRTRRLGFEIKRTSAPRITVSVRLALTDLQLDELTVVHAGIESFPMAERVRAVAADQLLSIEPIRRIGRPSAGF